MSLDSRRRSAISVQDLLCRNTSDNICTSPASNTEPSTASLSSPDLSLDRRILAHPKHPTSDIDPASSHVDTWQRHRPDANLTNTREPLHPLELTEPGNHDLDDKLQPDAGDVGDVGDASDPSRRKSIRGPWRIEEDRLLIELVSKYGPRHWSAIATHFPRRTGKQARERWMNQLNPALKKKNWSAEEDRIILRAHASLGNKWSAIANLLPGRTDNSVKNRYNSTLKRAMKERALTSRSFDIDEFVESLHAKPYVLNPSLDTCLDDRSSLGYTSLQGASNAARSSLPDLPWVDRGGESAYGNQSGAATLQERWNLDDSALCRSYQSPFIGRQSCSLPDIRGRMSSMYGGYREERLEPLSRLTGERDMNFGSGGLGNRSHESFAMPLSNEMLRTGAIVGRPQTSMGEHGEMLREDGRYRRTALSDDNRFPARKSITKERTGRMNSF